MIVEHLGGGAAIAATFIGLAYGWYRTAGQLNREILVSKSLDREIARKNSAIERLQSEVASWKADRVKRAKAGGIARGAQRRAERDEARAKTIEALGSFTLPPREVVVDGVRQARKFKISGGGAAPTQGG